MPPEDEPMSDEAEEELNEEPQDGEMQWHPAFIVPLTPGTPGSESNSESVALPALQKAMKSPNRGCLLGSR